MIIWQSVGGMSSPSGPEASWLLSSSPNEFHFHAIYINFNGRKSKFYEQLIIAF